MDEQQQQQQQQQQQHPSSLDTGDLHNQEPQAVQRLLDLGFEYQRVSCDKHQAECNDPKSRETLPCFDCRTKLFHLHPTPTMISPENQNQFVPKGSKFGAVSDVCQTIIQCRLVKQYHLQKIRTSSDDEPGIEAFATPNYFDDLQHCPILIIIPGKGDSRAGILSTKEIVLSGMETGSTEFFLERARCCGMAMILLDPNARGPRSGMTCLESSLTALFEDNGNHDRRPLFVLAHSAAGGYFVRYLLLGQRRKVLQKKIQAICFTDSTHNIQWAKPRRGDTGENHGDELLFDFLQSSRCLYIRNTVIHHLDTFASSKDRKLGEEIPHDVHWERRFGTVRTVWAGTTEHSRICWEGRHIIWEFLARHLLELS
jgi:hypothetical protein